MFRTLFLIVIALCLAIVGGVWSINTVLGHFDGFGRTTINGWQAYPQDGTEEADPYARARTVRQGTLSLGRAEGLAFYIWKDDSGQALTSRCRYTLQGFVPEARLFTLYPVDEKHTHLNAGSTFPTGLHSQNIVHDPDGAIHVTISATSAAGNWLAVPPRTSYGLVLTLYDTPVITTTGLANPVMPTLSRIKEGRCD